MLFRRVLPTLVCALVATKQQAMAAATLPAGSSIDPSLQAASPPVGADWPWYNVSLPQEVRLKALVDAMTPAELVTQLVKYSQRIDRLGVPQYAWHMEAAHGVAAPGNESSFPCSLARAAAFDPEMEEMIARATGEEARAKWNQYRLLHDGATPPYHSQGISLTTYAPEINLCRDPRWGRCQESRGEDPFLTARLTVPFVRGLQHHPLSSKQLLTTAMLKDFVVYNLESCISSNPVVDCRGGRSSPDNESPNTERLRYNAIVTEADLRQSFLPAFVAGIREGQARSAMTSYHALNGVPQTAHPLIQGELREALGWQGLMMSDGGAVSDIVNFQYLGLPMADNYTAAAAAALTAGVDLNSGGFEGTSSYNPPASTDGNRSHCELCPLNMSGYAYEHLPQALELGMITEQQLRTAATRTLRLRFDLGLFDPPESSPFSHITAATLASNAHQQLAKRSAAASLVLLRNTNSTLPLPAPQQLEQLAVIGPNADDAAALLSNYNGCNGGKLSCTLVTAREGLRAALDAHGGAGVNLAYAEGCGRKKIGDANATINAAATIAANSDAAVLVLGLVSAAGGASANLEGEAYDRRDGIGLPGHQLALARAVIAAQPRTVVVLISGGMVSEPWLASTAPALVQQFYPGMRGGEALAEALFGWVPFSGRLPVTVVQDLTQLPPYMVEQLSHPPGRTYRYLTAEPLYPFGYGLTSHAAVHYSVLKVFPATVPADAPGNFNLTVEVEVSGLLISQTRAIAPSTVPRLDSQNPQSNTTDFVAKKRSPDGNGSCTLQANMDYDQPNTPCFSRDTVAECCSLCLATDRCVAFSFHAGLACPTALGATAAKVKGSRCWLKDSTAGLRPLQGCVAGLCHDHTPPAPPPPLPPPLPVGSPKQEEIVQVYFGWSGEAREQGQSSVPLHELKAFRRIALPDLTSSGKSAPMRLHFNISLSSLYLMQPNGQMGLLPGAWHVWAGGTSPGTPKSLLRPSQVNVNGDHFDGSSGTPQEPLVTSWTVTGGVDLASRKG